MHWIELPLDAYLLLARKFTITNAHSGVSTEITHIGKEPSLLVAISVNEELKPSFMFPSSETNNA